MAIPSAVKAMPFTFTLTGYFNAADSISGTAFADATPFTMSASFNSANPSLLPPAPVFNGFVAYTPSAVTLAVNGQVYDVTPYSAAQPTGVAVAIFDASSVFGPPGHYAAGFIQNPVADGAGIVGDWLSAAPPYLAANLTDTSLPASGFFGVGFSSGACVSGCRTAARVDAVTPIPLTLGTANLSLTLGSYDLDAASSVGQPGSTPGAALTAPFTAILVPEPGSFVLLALSLLGFGWLRLRQ